MKTFIEFTNEELNYIDSGYYSQAYKGSKYDILKKSLNLSGKYNETEIELYQLMKKRPDLFCKVYKNSEDEILLEQLDTKKFLADFNKYIKFLSDEIDILDKYSLSMETEDPDHENSPKYQKTIEESKFLDSVYFAYDWHGNYSEFEIRYDRIIKNSYWNDIPDFVKNFILKKKEIYDFLREFVLEHSRTGFDLHKYNFGFKKGTKEIRCFDPLYV